MRRLKSGLLPREDFLIRKVFALAALMILFGNGLHAETVTLSAVADTALFERDPEFNFGAQGDLPAGTLGSTVNERRSRALFRFELAGNIPEGAVIEFAAVRLEVVRDPAGTPADSTFALHRMLKDWGEGNQESGRPGGGPAEVGEATWFSRFHPDQFWAFPGGDAGVDFEEAPSATERVSGEGTYEFELTNEALEDLQGWAEADEANFGWMLLSQDEDTAKTARRFAAREHSDPELRPALRIRFNVKPAAPVIREIQREGDEVVIRFQAEAAVVYRLQSRRVWRGDTWQTVETAPAVQGDGESEFRDSILEFEKKYYRIQAEAE